MAGDAARIGDSGEFDAPASREPEVKGLTFVTMRGFLPEYLGEARYTTLLERLSPETRSRLLEVETPEWMPESEMHELLRELFDQEFDGDDESFREFARELASAGIGRFMRIFLSLASERFVLKKIPVVWDRLRRNAGSVTAETGEDIVRLSYDGFPYLGDRVYRLLSLANCEALVFAATQRYPLGRISHWSRDSMIVEFELRS